MEQQFSAAELKKLAAQLRCPQGKTGIETGLNMNTGNQAMIATTLELLALPDHAVVLELGPGNAQHLSSLLDQYTVDSYHGLEISQTMCAQATLLNRHLNQSKISFSCYGGLKLPFGNGSFDVVFTINTIYFWEQPQLLLAEIARVLKPGGKFLLTFAQAAFMQQLPFVQYGFTLYDTEKVAALLTGTSLEIETEWQEQDLAISKIGTKVERQFSVLQLKRSVTQEA